MGQFISFGEGVVCSQCVFEKLFKLFDMYDVLERCMLNVNSLFDGECCCEF